MDIDRNKLKIKHIINIDTGIVDEEDFLYNCIQAYEEKSWDPYNRGATIPQLKWAGVNKTIDGCTLEESLDKLIKMKYMDIKQTNGAQYYVIIDHPWK